MSEVGKGGWMPISTMPQDGSTVRLRRNDCPGYDTTGGFKDWQFIIASFFVRGDGALFERPTHWAPLTAQEASQ